MSNHSVLIIEDDVAIRTLTTRVLRRKHMHVDDALDGAEGLLHLQRRQYDAILLDLMMPRKSGYEVVRDLQEQHSELLNRTIIMTAVDDKKLREVENAGIYTILRKPFDLDRLYDTIMACIEANPKIEDWSIPALQYI